MRITALFASLVVLCCLVGCGTKPQATTTVTPQAAPPEGSATTPGAPPAAAPAGEAGKTGVALGQQIFTTGVGTSGQHIAFTEGSDRFKSKPGGCVGCHGDDGHGRKTAKGSTPDITYSALRGAKPLYPSDEAVLKAVREGVDQEGGKLAKAMPRWQLSDAEGQAVLEQLKALASAPKAAPPAAPK
jgi:mono/diheme cytochrome c family protein